jgi:hypothetical protein
METYPVINNAPCGGVPLRYFALDGTDHATHEQQGSMIRRYIIWRNNHAYPSPTTSPNSEQVTR